MADRTLSNPTIEINDDIIAIVPNSLSFKRGGGNKTVKSQSAGGNSVSVVVTEDASTKKSMVKFKLFNTVKNLDLVKDWAALFGSTIRLSEQDLSESFRSMILITDPEIAVGADGELELEWEGAPVL